MSQPTSSPPGPPRTGVDARIPAVLALIVSVLLGAVLLMPRERQQAPTTREGLRPADGVMLKEAEFAFASTPPPPLGFRFGDSYLAHNYDRLMTAHAQLEDAAVRRDRAAIGVALMEFESAHHGVLSSAAHDASQVRMMVVQLCIALGLALLGSVLALSGRERLGGVLLLVAAVSPLLYGVVVQPFTVEPLVGTFAFGVLGVLSLIWAARQRRAAVAPAAPTVFAAAPPLGAPAHH